VTISSKGREKRHTYGKTGEGEPIPRALDKEVYSGHEVVTKRHKDRGAGMVRSWQKPGAEVQWVLGETSIGKPRGEIKHDEKV